MPDLTFIWDDQENVPHLAEHGVTPEEAAWVVEHAEAGQIEMSRTTGNPIAFGCSPSGKHLAVVYWIIDERKRLAYIETAFETPPRRSRNRG